ncbi:FcoT family thioesterase [Micromonospora sp. WMMD1082]|uniref:FcoT family thioesterase n=1 Tax=Micromonospora sp. WMMD1082 TaxID=3016104 RepID=UPI002416601F|nr:FcoT family thioesterase [Micromonospora sp. WMMD1082]MDG4794574.1 FcoT family thioesterase [Micromonospora sp. WMMD1082]
MTELMEKSSALHFGDDRELLREVLKPYRDNCKYLRSATMSVVDGVATAYGEFAIPNSCYIDDTGHFNSVEFNICFNQLGYYLTAKCIKERALAEFSSWNMDDYYERQLPDILITALASRFRRAIDSDAFQGETSFGPFTERNVRRPMLLNEMPVRFWDTAGGKATGTVNVVLFSPALSTVSASA